MFDRGVFQAFDFINDKQLNAFKQRFSAVMDPDPGVDGPVTT